MSSSSFDGHLPDATSAHGWPALTVDFLSAIRRRSPSDRSPPSRIAGNLGYHGLAPTWRGTAGSAWAIVAQASSDFRIGLNSHQFQPSVTWTLVFQDSIMELLPKPKAGEDALQEWSLPVSLISWYRPAIRVNPRLTGDS